MPKIIQFKPPEKFDQKAYEPSDLVQCPKCGGEISMKAIRCRHCGIHFHGGALQFTKDEQKKYEGVSKKALILGIAVVVVVVLFAMSRV